MPFVDWVLTGQSVKTLVLGLDPELERSAAVGQVLSILLKWSGRQEVAEPCPVGCGRPCSLGREFCLACWRHVPIKNQRELYLLGQQLRYEQNNQGLQYAYQLALDRAIRAVPA